MQINSSLSIPSQLKGEQSLTRDQQSIISNTLSQYDADNLTEADALSIANILSDANINPSKALEKSMAEFGFDAKTIGDLANVDQKSNRPPPPKQSNEDITSMVDYLAELLEQRLATSENGKLSDEDKQLILSQLFEKFEIEEGDSIINTTA